MFLSSPIFDLYWSIEKRGLTTPSRSPAFNPSYILSETHFRMQKQMDSLIINFENCDKKKLNCDNNLQPKVSKKLGYYILNKK